MRSFFTITDPYNDLPEIIQDEIYLILTILAELPSKNQSLLVLDSNRIVGQSNQAII
jgi:hypothetical protein